MGFLDGDLAELVGTALVDAGLSLPAVLTKVTATPRITGSPTAATAPATQDFRCDGFVARLEPYRIRGTLIEGVSRVVKIYGSTLATAPVPGDRVTIEGATTVIVNDDAGKKAVQRDPAGAVWTLQTA